MAIQERRGALGKALCMGVALATTWSAAAWAAHSEAEFLGDFGVASLAARLPQPLADAPGAVTVIDRETTRRSGARDLVDLLRWVPGFFVSGWSGAHRIASYHASLDEYGTRMQVNIDGRSVYSTFFLGGSSTAMTAIAIDDIERVEVLRGANSASFGTNAMFGVINVVTRHAGDTPGIAGRVAAGSNGIGDVYARAGGGAPGRSWRLSATSRGDEGFTHVPDTRRVDQFTLRGDLAVADGELMLVLGHQRLRTFNGFANDPTDKLHAVREAGDFAAVRWRRPLADGGEFVFAADMANESFDDHWDYELFPGFAVGADLGGTARRGNLEFQHIARVGESVRFVWGAAALTERTDAMPAFHVARVENDRLQLFAHAEWQPDPAWTVNAGGLLERHDAGGREFAPRLAVNWHLSPTQTLRAAATRAFRMPTLFESYADMRFFEVHTGMFVLRQFYNARPPEPERVVAREIGYLVQWPQWRANLDVRIFGERSERLIMPVPNAAPAPHDSALTAANIGEIDTQGIEYHARWQPTLGTDIRIAQTFMQPSAPAGTRLANFVPRHIGSIGIMQSLPWNLELSGLLSAVDTVSARRIGARTIGHTVQLDLRLARAFRLGSARAEGALAWHAVSGEVPIYDPERRYAIPRQAFVSLAVEL